MAVNAKVLRVERRYIETDKGLLHFPVSHIDSDIVVGDSLRVDKMIDGSTWTPMSVGVSTFWNNVGGSADITVTAFKSSDGSLKYVFDGYRGYISFAYKTGGTPATIGLAAIFSGDTVSTTFDIGLVVDPSGNAYTSMSCKNGYYGVRGSTTVPNTTDNLGSYTNTVRDGYFSITTVTQSNVDIANALLNLSSEVSSDPYAQGGESTTGGGTGDFDGRSDNIDIPELPSATATDAGFITLFNPTLSQMRSLASYMWSDAFDLETFRKLFADPMDAILGLSIVPVAVPSGGAREVRVGNIGTGVSMNVATSQYVTVDCGTLNVNEYWGAYLDYEPFTKAEIYLPYIGTHPIAVDDIMGKAVHVVYHVDVLSGACVAYVKCGGSVLYNFIGQCSSSIPITGNDWTNVINGVLNIAGSIGSMVATGGLSAPAALGTVASTAVNSMKPAVEKSGAISGTGGLMGIQKPYLILTRPRQAVPKNQNKYTGYPAYINRKLSDLSGYTEVDQIHIEGVYATEQEYAELDSLIRRGVIF